MVLCFTLFSGPSRADVDANTVRAMQALRQKQWIAARDIVAQDKDPLGVKLYQWLFLTREESKDYPTMQAQFIRSNPDWPSISTLSLSFEKNMPKTMSPKEITAWFDDYKPQTTNGMERYINALLAQGRKGEAQRLLGDWWAKTALSRDEQIRIYKEYGAYLDTEAHRKRLDTLLLNAQYTNARGIARVLGEDYVALAEARIALAEEKPEANTRLAAVPQLLQGDYGLIYERIRWRRKKDMNAGVVELLQHMPSMTKVSNGDAWWRERHIMARRFIEEKNYRAAYDMARGHGHTSGVSFAEGEFLAGWLALRFLHQPEAALKHFTALYGGVETPISKSRGAYWAGRAAKDLQSYQHSNAWFQKAAQYQTTYYGQLAAAELGNGVMSVSALDNAAPPPLSGVENAKFNANELVRVAKILHKAGFESETGKFLQAFAKADKTSAGYHFAALTAAQMDMHNESVMIAKEATKKGLFLTAQSYPLFHRHMDGVNTELALLHGIIRQESQFDLKAQSPAGAMGLMQLMPGTAQDTARKIGVSYDRGRLTSDARYNIALGSSYISQLVSRFGGSYPLAIAGYNAGPVRVDKWIKQFGDPRTGEIDLIDWIESIPISETRNYVQRVMEGIYVYRLRLKNIQKTPHARIHVAMR